MVTYPVCCRTMGRRADPILLSPVEHSLLARWARRRSAPVRLARRARIILMAAAGAESKTIAEQLRTSRATVQLWRQRFLALRVAGLVQDAPRPGRTASISAEEIRAIVKATVQTTPCYATRWSTRRMARAHGLSEATIRRIWKQHNLAPHLVKPDKPSRDKHGFENQIAVVGLYSNPPDRCLVLAVYEKRDQRVRDRPRLGLPMQKGRLGTRLCAALRILEGCVIGDSMPRDRYHEVIRFLKRLDAVTRAGAGLHVIAGNSGTHTHPRVTSWLQRHPRFHLRCASTSRSWLNFVERSFRQIAGRRIRGALQNVGVLNSAIRGYLDNPNQHARIFVWIASLEDLPAQAPTVKKQ
ncbi:MAG: ISBmu8 transposase [Deltaproteobacteria bacterium]|nr:ISBmu8 transposase [Deltaproteobacteria bacterium]